MAVRFDAYTATMTGVEPGVVMGRVFTAVGLCEKVRSGRGFHTFAERMAFRDASGSEVASVQWGGKVQGDRVMVEAKGESTPRVVEALRSDFQHRVTRVDACADFDDPGAFSRLLEACTRVKKAHRIKGGKAGDWDDFPEDGRTLYLGAKSSPVRARLYEKGRQREYVHLNRPDWVRLEVQVRPKGPAMDAYAKVAPLEAWGASIWSRELAANVLQEHVEPHPAGTVYRLSDSERALRWMCKQYGTHLVGLYEELGSWDCVGRTLGEMIIAEQEAERMRKRRH